MLIFTLFVDGNSFFLLAKSFIFISDSNSYKTFPAVYNLKQMHSILNNQLLRLNKQAVQCTTRITDCVKCMMQIHVFAHSAETKEQMDLIIYLKFVPTLRDLAGMHLRIIYTMDAGFSPYTKSKDLFLNLTHLTFMFFL